MDQWVSGPVSQHVLFWRGARVTRVTRTRSYTLAAITPSIPHPRDRISHPRSPLLLHGLLPSRVATLFWCAAVRPLLSLMTWASDIPIAPPYIPYLALYLEPLHLTSILPPYLLSTSPPSYLQPLHLTSILPLCLASFYHPTYLSSTSPPSYHPTSHLPHLVQLALLLDDVL